MPLWIFPTLLGFAGGATLGTIAGVNVSRAVKVAAVAGAVAYIWRRTA